MENAIQTAAKETDRHKATPTPELPHCEFCGYEIAAVLESAGVNAPCPECGVALLRSSPTVRKGTPWQRGISLTSFWLSIWRTLASPRELFRTMEASGKSALSLLVIQSFIASIAFISPWSGVFIADPVRQLRFARTVSRALTILSTVAAEIAVLAILIGAGTLAIGAVLNAYARSRGWVLPRGTMRSITAHAAIGWTVVAGVVWSLLTAWFIATLIVSSAGSPNASRALGETSGWLASNAGRFGVIPLPLIVFGSGAAIVARLTLTGILECRYANSPSLFGLFIAGTQNPEADSRH